MFNNLDKLESFIIAICFIIGAVFYVVTFLVSELIIYPIKRLLVKSKKI